MQKDENRGITLCCRKREIKPWNKTQESKTPSHTTNTWTLHLKDTSGFYQLFDKKSKLKTPFHRGNWGRELVIYIIYIYPCCKGKIKPRCNDLAAALCRVPRKRALKRGLIILMAALRLYWAYMFIQLLRYSPARLSCSLLKHWFQRSFHLNKNQTTRDNKCPSGRLGSNAYN